MEVDINKICIMPARKSDFYEKKAPRCMFGALLEVEPCKICSTPARARAIWKLKSLTTDGLGTFFKVQSVFRVAGAGI